jgi:hypothetical protein
MFCNVQRQTKSPARLLAALIPLSFAVWGQISSCDLNGDGVVDSADVVLAVDMALGTKPCTANVEGPGICTILTVQRVINASQKRKCVANSLPSVANSTAGAATNSNGTGNATLTPSITAVGASPIVSPKPASPPSLSEAVRRRPLITSATSAGGTVGTAFSYQITATNSPTSYGATGLPAGLSVNTATGLISGTPTSAGTSMVTVKATNAIGTGSATLTLTITSTASTGISLVQVASGVASGTASTFYVTFPNNTVKGDLILVGADFSTDAFSSITDSQGNTFTEVGSQLPDEGGLLSRVYYAKNINGGADTVTINLSANSSWIEVYLTEYSGVDQTSPIDAQASASGNGGAVSSGVGTTTAAGDLIYGYCVGQSNCTAGSGFTALTTLDRNLVEQEIAGSPGSYAATGNAGSGWAMQMVALKPASASGGSAPIITSGTSANGTVGNAFSYQITATNSPTSYGATGLPPGLSANTATGLISGTPASASTSTVTVKATNGSGTGSATLTLTIASSMVPTITSATSASGTVGSAFSYQITATNSPTSYSATGLLAGLAVNTATGLISGTPTAAGTSTVTLGAANSGGTGNATLTLTITLGAPVITSATSAGGTVGSAFSYQITATNLPTSYGATGLPPGLSVNTATGLISGTPTSASISAVTVKAANSSGTGSATLTLTIASSTVPAITSATSASGTVGIAFSYQITATNSPTSYSATSLPAGLSVNTANGSISGTPTSAGTSAVTVKATNGSGTGSATLTLTIASSTVPTITSATSASGTVGIAFSYQITATNSATSYSATGLPGGLSVNISTGLISGTPTSVGTSTVTLGATNTGGTGHATLTLTITPGAPTITSATTASGTVGVAFSYQITATNSPTSYSATGLPGGLSVNTATGLISGTPTAGATFTVTLGATNVGGTGHATLTLTIGASASHSVTLSWVASSSPNIAGYDIYRGTTSMSGPFGPTPLNPSLITTLSYVDTSVVAGTTYYYVATAVNTSGVQSGDSTPIAVVIP